MVKSALFQDSTTLHYIKMKDINFNVQLKAI